MMLKRFKLPSGGKASLSIDEDATEKDYIFVLRWLHQKISEENWKRIRKMIEENSYES